MMGLGSDDENPLIQGARILRVPAVHLPVL